MYLVCLQNVISENAFFIAHSHYYCHSIMQWMTTTTMTRLTNVNRQVSQFLLAHVIHQTDTGTGTDEK